MKNEIRGVVLALLTALLFYLGGAFMFAALNIATWPEIGRVLTAGIGGFFAAVVYAHSTGKIGA